MATSKSSLSNWFDNGVRQGSSYMIVVCDTFDWKDYPVYCNTEYDTLEKYNHYHGQNMQKVMKVYNLKSDKLSQMNEHRAMHLPEKV